MARIRLASHIQTVKLMIGHIVATTKGGEQHRYPYERLTEAQEMKLRKMAQPPKKRQTIKSSPDSGRRHNRGYSPAADVASRCVLVSANGRLAGVVEVENV